MVSGSWRGSVCLGWGDCPLLYLPWADGMRLGFLLSEMTVVGTLIWWSYLSLLGLRKRSCNTSSGRIDHNFPQDTVKEGGEGNFQVEMRMFIGSVPVREELKSLPPHITLIMFISISLHWRHVKTTSLSCKGSWAGEPRASWQGWVQICSFLVLKSVKETNLSVPQFSYLFRKDRDTKLNFFPLQSANSIALRL